MLRPVPDRSANPGVTLLIDHTPSCPFLVFAFHRVASCSFYSPSPISSTHRLSLNSQSLRRHPSTLAAHQHKIGLGFRSATISAFAAGPTTLLLNDNTAFSIPLDVACSTTPDQSASCLHVASMDRLRSRSLSQAQARRSFLVSIFIFDHFIVLLVRDDGAVSQLRASKFPILRLVGFVFHCRLVFSFSTTPPRLLLICFCPSRHLSLLIC